jgi:hypothetical protein
MDLHLGQPPEQREPGRVCQPVHPEHRHVPGAIRHGRRLGGKGGRGLLQVGGQRRRGAAGAGRDPGLPRLPARVLRRPDPGPGPDQQVAKPVRVAGQVRQHVPAAPAGQPRGLPGLGVGEPVRGGRQPAGRRVDPRPQAAGVAVHRVSSRSVPPRPAILASPVPRGARREGGEERRRECGGHTGEGHRRECGGHTERSSRVARRDLTLPVAIPAASLAVIPLPGSASFCQTPRIPWRRASQSPEDRRQRPES